MEKCSEMGGLMLILSNLENVHDDAQSGMFVNNDRKKEMFQLIL